MTGPTRADSADRPAPAEPEVPADGSAFLPDGSVPPARRGGYPRPETPSHVRLTRAGVLWAAATAVVLVGLGVAEYRTFDYLTVPPLVWLRHLGIAWAVFAVAAILLRRTPVRLAVPLLLLGAVGLQVVAMSSPPNSSTDWYRYVWDGRVQAAGVDPYKYAPDDPALNSLHIPYLFPGPSKCAALHQPAGCTVMNRPSVHTIYPPVAEAYFVLVHYVSPPDHLRIPMQLAAALMALAVTVLLLLLVRRTRGDPRNVVFWAWCPVVFLETGNNAHVDVLGVLFVLAGFWFALRGRMGRAGTLVGAAIATKMYPALVLPGLMRRRPLLVLCTALGTFAVVYVPHVMAVGSAVVGYLPGYLHENGYSGAGRFAVLRLFLPAALTPYAALLFLLFVAAVASLRADPFAPWRSALIVTGAAYLQAAPSYPWYSILIAALVALDGRWEYLAIPVAGYVMYMAPLFTPNLTAAEQWSYGLAGLMIIVCGLARWWRGIAVIAADEGQRPTTADKLVTVRRAVRVQVRGLLRLRRSSVFPRSREGLADTGGPRPLAGLSALRKGAVGRGPGD